MFLNQLHTVMLSASSRVKVHRVNDLCTAAVTSTTDHISMISLSYYHAVTSQILGIVGWLSFDRLLIS